MTMIQLVKFTASLPCGIFSVITCDDVVPPEYGAIVSYLDQYALGSTITYACNRGYFTSGILTAVCQEHGWSSPKPYCYGKC